MATACLHRRRNGSREYHQPVFSAEPRAFLGTFRDENQDRDGFCRAGRRRMVSVFGTGFADAFPGCARRDARRLYSLCAEKQEAARKSDVLFNVRDRSADVAVSLETL